MEQEADAAALDPGRPAPEAAPADRKTAGDAARERAFLDVLAAQGRRLRRIAWSFGRGADAEDLYQEIACQLWRGLSSYRGEAALGTWVYRVALNTALTHSRRRQRRRGEELMPNDVLAQAPGGETGAGGPRTEEAILEDFLSSLGDVDRSVLILYLDGLSYLQVSEVTGLSPGLVGVRLHRIKKAYVQRYVGG